MKIFLDTANLEEIQQAADFGLLEPVNQDEVKHHGTTKEERVTAEPRGTRDDFLPRVGRKRVLVVRKVKTEMPAVLTIGHSTHTWKNFLELLRAHCVKRIIDVRRIPRSRHNPQFNRETLSAKLRAARIGYVHL